MKLILDTATRNDALQSKSGRYLRWAGMILLARRLLLALLAVVFVSMALFLTPVSVFATDLPDATPTAEFYVYRNILETGDWLLLIYQNIPYATIPDTPVWQNYIWRLLATDNVTELGTALSYAFNDNGYGYNLTSMYWNAANVTASGMVWGTNYPVRLSGTPGMFTTPPEYNFTINSADYSLMTAADDVEAELSARILTIAADLDIRWALGATYSLLNQTETGTVLSIYGEAFFRAAIYGLQGMCPDVFAYVIKDLEITPRTWSTGYATTLENQHAGTWVDTAKAAGSALFGTTYNLTWLLVTLLLAAGVMIAGVMLHADAWQSLGIACIVVIGMTRLGLFELGFLALLGAIAWIYGAVRIWGVLR